MTRLVCLDLETTGVDIKTAQVVQFGAIEVDTEADPDWIGESREQLCDPGISIPAAAAAVHKITDEMVKDAPHFRQVAANVFDWIDDALVVTFNGATYDLPILTRPVLVRGEPCKITNRWRPQRHIDVMRVWQYMQRTDEIESPASHDFKASEMRGRLGVFYHWVFGHGHTLVDAHNALVDCRGTLDGLREIVLTGLLTLDRCEQITSEPLPGDVDWSGKLQWDGDEIVFAFGKHKDKPVRGELHGRGGYVSWMLGADFPEDTCKILRAMQRGVFPKRVTT